MPREVIVQRPDGSKVRVIQQDAPPPQATMCDWVDQNLGISLWSVQRQILQALEDHDKVVVPTCHGIGKTFIAAVADVAWIQTRTPSYIVTTAPNATQVKQLLWKEIRALWQQLPADLAKRGECMTTHIKMYHEGTKKLNPKHYSYGRATNTPGRFQGQHAENLMVIVDEAAELDDEMFGIIDTFGAAKELLIGNPTKTAGKFYHAVKDPSLGYHCIRVRANQTPNFTGQTDGLPDWVLSQMISPKRVEQWAAYWGKESAWYRSRVEAEFPEEGAEDVLVPELWFNMAMKREHYISLHPEVQIGVDSAHFGTDRTAIATRADRSLVDLQSFAGHTTTQDVVRHVQTAVAAAQLRYKPRRVTVIIDRTGTGAGVSDILTAGTSDAVVYKGVAFSERPRDTERFANVRAEMYWRLREAFQPGGPGDMIAVSIPPDKARPLQGQLSNIHYAFNDRQKVQIESKDQLRQRGLNSPDEADAVALALAPYMSPPLVVDLPEIKTMMSGTAGLKRLSPIGWRGW